MCLKSVPLENAVAEPLCSRLPVLTAHSMRCSLDGRQYFGSFSSILFFILTPLKPVLILQGFEEQRQQQMWDLPGVIPSLSLYYYFFIQNFKSSFGGYKFIINKAEGGLIDYSVMLSINIYMTSQMLLLWLEHTRTHLSFTATPSILFSIFFFFQ